MHQPWPPRWLSNGGHGSDRAESAIRFIEGYCRVTKSSLGGEYASLIRLREWQKQLIRYILSEDAAGTLLFRFVLIGIARKNGKSALLTALALWALCLGPEGGEIYSVAGDREQARITFSAAKQMIKLDPELSKILVSRRDHIEYPARGSKWFVVSSDADLKEGMNPSFVLFDELHVASEELFNVWSNAFGARQEPLFVAITTAGKLTTTSGEPTIARRMYLRGVEIAKGDTVDETFGMCWWEPSKGVKAEYEDEDIWPEANPGLGDLLSVEDMRSLLGRSTKSDFMTKKCNLWVTTEQTWIDVDSIVVAERWPPDGTEIAAAFDGSYSGDASALVGCTVPQGDELPHLFLIKAWEKPLVGAEDFDPNWKVDFGDVDLQVDEMFKRWDVKRLACDPYRWQQAIAMWAKRWGASVVLEFPNTNARMGPACGALLERFLKGTITFDGSEVLTRHIGNAREKPVGSYGTTIHKGKNAGKIDAAVAAVMALDSAQTPSRGSVSTFNGSIFEAGPGDATPQGGEVSPASLAEQMAAL